MKLILTHLRLWAIAFASLINKNTRRLIVLFLAILFMAFQSDTLPNVLIIGDSISIGYTPFVQSALKGKANVVHNPGNAQHTGTGLEKLDEWLGDNRWDIIHFNWGLWDLAYRSEQSKVYGNRDKINGTVTFTPEEYRKNLEELVIRLKKTGAKLVFATTSFVPQGEAGRVFGDDVRYNRVAKNVMKHHHVQVNDLNKLSKKIHRKHKKAEGDVHFTSEGYRLLAQPVIDVISKNL